VLDEDAIELCTWHASKGREWPVVAVCGLDRTVAGRLPSLDLGYAGFDDLAHVLEQARVEYAPSFAAPESNAPFQAELDAREEVEVRRQLYVALTRARDKLLLEWPSYVGNTKTTRWSLLASSCGLDLARDGILVREQRFDCRVLEGPGQLPDALELGRVSAVECLPRVGRRAIRPAVAPANLTPDGRTPSEAVVAVEPAIPAGLVTERYGDALHVDVGLSGVALGSFLHRAFEVLGARPDLAPRFLALSGVAADEAEIDRIAAAVSRFEAWLSQRFPGAAVRREWPVLCVDDAGTVVNGTIDLVVETADGVWILDHKSDAIEDPLAGFGRYEQQLAAYRLALAAGGATIAGIGIHWAGRGEVTLRAAQRP
jgi:ATP-dependent exoDNAse (exonuclease V) beta subunit